MKPAKAARTLHDVEVRPIIVIIFCPSLEEVGHLFSIIVKRRIYMGVFQLVGSEIPGERRKELGAPPRRTHALGTRGASKDES